jgi:hypothetical protein
MSKISGLHTQPAALIHPASDSRYRVCPRISLLTCWLNFSQVGLFQFDIGSTHWVTISSFIPEWESQRSGFILARCVFLPVYGLWPSLWYLIGSMQRQNPTFIRNGVLIISPCQPLGYRLFFSFLYRLRKLSEAGFIFPNNRTNFLVMKFFTSIVIIQRAFWILFWHLYSLIFLRNHE